MLLADTARVVVIDDDPHILDAFSTLLCLEGYAVERYASAKAYLQVLESGAGNSASPACVLCDVVMPEMDGLELQHRLACLAEPGEPSLVLMSGSSGAREAVHGFRAGAVDFLLKPISSEHLLDAVARAVAVTSQKRQRAERGVLIRQQIAQLSEREREVMHRVAAGVTNHGIALALAITERTVKFHRQRVIEKLGLTGTTDIARFVQEFEQLGGAR